LAIPPGDSNYEVDASSVLQYDCDLVSMMPHAHLRGKSFEYRIVRPDGTSETVLSVPKYDFNWQLFYYLAEPLVLPKGTRIDCVAHFDNSPNNPDNADPTKEVTWGDQSWDEMMVGFFNLVFDARMPVKDIFVAQKAAKAGGGL
jgi:hypothetical protein